MARDVEYAVTAADQTGTALASAEAKFKATQDRINRESAKTGDGLKKAADKGASAIGRLKSELSLAEGELRRLGEAYARAGSAAERLDITKQIRQQKSEISSLKGVIESIGPEVAKAGVRFGPVLLTAAASAAPFVGAVISSAVIGGAGVGGVIGGVTLAAKDPRVKSAGAELSQNLLADLKVDSGPFIDPVLKNINKVGVAFDRLRPRIQNVFRNSSQFLDPLVDGTLAGVGGVLRGVDSLVAKGGPVINAFGRLVANEGQAIGDAFETISGGADDAAHALDDAGAVTASATRQIGYLVRGLTELYGFLSAGHRAVGNWERELLGMSKTEDLTIQSTSVLAAVQKTVTQVMLTAGEAAGDAGLHMSTYADQMDAATTKGRGLYDSQTQVADAVAKAKKAVDENGKTLDINSEKGRANRNILSDLAGTLTDNYQAYVKVNGEGAAAGRVAASNREQFIKLAQQFGLSKKAAADLATQFGLIPANKTTNFHANTHDAEARAKALGDKLDAAARTRTANVNVVINTGRLSSIENRLNRLGGSLYNASGAMWAALDSSSGRSRTGGPTPVNVSNNVTVSLDGTPFYQAAVAVNRELGDRAAWRQRTGRRS